MRNYHFKYIVKNDSSLIKCVNMRKKIILNRDSVLMKKGPFSKLVFHMNKNKICSCSECRQKQFKQMLQKQFLRKCKFATRRIFYVNCFRETSAHKFEKGHLGKRSSIVQSYHNNVINPIFLFILNYRVSNISICNFKRLKYCQDSRNQYNEFSL